MAAPAGATTLAGAVLEVGGAVVAGAVALAVGVVAAVGAAGFPGATRGTGAAGLEPLGLVPGPAAAAVGAVAGADAAVGLLPLKLGTATRGGWPAGAGGVAMVGAGRCGWATRGALQRKLNGNSEINSLPIQTDVIAS